MFSSKSPILNLHGETTATVKFPLEDFINDNVYLGNEYVGVIHGISSNILKNEVYRILKNNENVLEYHLNIWNPGVTIIRLKITHQPPN